MDEHVLIPGEERGIPLVTRTGRHIPNRRRHQISAEIMKYAVAIIKEICPEARLRSLDTTYNCVGLIFASRRTNVDTDELSWILSDDDYKEVSEDQVEVGDLIMYRPDHGQTANHVGIIVEIMPNIAAAQRNFRVLSQWGSNGEYLHEAADVPTNWYGKHLNYFTQRVTELV